VHGRNKNNSTGTKVSSSALAAHEQNKTAQTTRNFILEALKCEKINEARVKLTKNQMNA
jgi:hypothetical protein